MNAELNNDTNNKDTVEQAQNQNGATPATDSDTSPATPIADKAPPTTLKTQNNSSLCTENSSLQEPELYGDSPQMETLPAAENEPQLTDHPEAETTTDHGQLATDQNLASPPAGPEPISLPPRGGASATALQATIALNKRQGRPSKVGQLPPDLIAFVNEQLLRRVPQGLIAQELEERGHPGFNKSNISNWKLGPFKKWAEAQQTLDQQNRQRELALDYARSHGTSLLEILEEIQAHNLYETAVAISPSRIVKKLQETPELFLKLNREISSFVKVCREKKTHSGSVGKKLESPSSFGRDQENTGGLTTEARDDVRARLGIRPPPDLVPNTIKPDPAKESEPMAQTPNTEPA